MNIGKLHKNKYQHIRRKNKMNMDKYVEKIKRIQVNLQKKKRWTHLQKNEIKIFITCVEKRETNMAAHMQKRSKHNSETKLFTFSLIWM